MQRDVAGIATAVPTMNLDEMSHQTGAQLIALLFHTMELMNWLRQANPVHTM